MKTFPFKVEEDLHIKIKVEAAKSGKTLGEWIKAVIEEKLEKVGG